MLCHLLSWAGRRHENINTFPTYWVWYIFSLSFSLFLSLSLKWCHPSLPRGSIIVPAIVLFLICFYFFYEEKGHHISLTPKPNIVTSLKKDAKAVKVAEEVKKKKRKIRETQKRVTTSLSQVISFAKTKKLRFEMYSWNHFSQRVWKSERRWFHHHRILPEDRIPCE